MNVIIKQKEIEAGIKLYLLQQGIQLNGKTTEISFTAGRKDSGLSAEIEINDMDGAVSVVDTMIGQQAPVAPVIAVPEVQAPVERLGSAFVVPEPIAKVAQELGVTFVASPFMHDAMTAEEEEAQAEEVVDPKVTAAVNALFETQVEDAIEDTNPSFNDADWEEVEAAPAPAPVVKSVSLFG